MNQKDNFLSRGTPFTNVSQPKGRINRVPSYDQQCHWVTGEGFPVSGEGMVPDVDNARIDHDDPMEFGAPDGRFESQSSDAIQAANLRQATGLDSAAGPTGEAVDMEAMGMNEGGAGGGWSASQYGTRGGAVPKP